MYTVYSRFSETIIRFLEIVSRAVSITKTCMIESRVDFVEVRN